MAKLYLCRSVFFAINSVSSAAKRDLLPCFSSFSSAYLGKIIAILYAPSGLRW